MGTRIPLRKDGVLARQLGDESVLYDSERESVHIINSMAEYIWNLCDGSRSMEEIERHIRDTYSIPDGNAVQQDLENIIQSFVDLEILSFTDA